MGRTILRLCRFVYPLKVIQCAAPLAAEYVVISLSLRVGFDNRYTASSAWILSFNELARCYTPISRSRALDGTEYALTVLPLTLGSLNVFAAFFAVIGLVMTVSLTVFRCIGA